MGLRLISAVTRQMIGCRQTILRLLAILRVAAVENKMTLQEALQDMARDDLELIAMRAIDMVHGCTDDDVDDEEFDQRWEALMFAVKSAEL